MFKFSFLVFLVLVPSVVLPMEDYRQKIERDMQEYINSKIVILKELANTTDNDVSAFDTDKRTKAIIAFAIVAKHQYVDFCPNYKIGINAKTIPSKIALLERLANSFPVNKQSYLPDPIRPPAQISWFAALKKRFMSWF